MIKVVIASGLLLMASCSAYDLGDESPQSIPVDAQNPTWDNGIGALVAAKCVNCHTATPNKFVPSDVPALLHAASNDIGTQAFWENNTKSSGFPAHAYARTFLDSHDPMPPKFATPLTDSERTAFQSYLTNLGLTDLCPTQDSSLTFSDVQSITAAGCSNSTGCHANSGNGADTNSSGRAVLESLAQWKKYRWNSIAYLAEGFMPLGQPTYVNSEAGQNILTWLCGGSDLK